MYLHRPLVQSKLSVLSKAGLTKDDFSEADTKRMVNPQQRDIMSYFEESFMEEGEEDIVTDADQKVELKEGEGGGGVKGTS